VTKHHDAARVVAADCLCFRARRVSRALTRMYTDAALDLRDRFDATSAAARL